MPVTMKDIANIANVSRTTVSMVLNDTPNVSISEEVRKKVLKIASDLNYRPSVAARVLNNKLVKSIGYAVYEVKRSFGGESIGIFGGFEETLVKHGFGLQYVSTNPNGNNVDSNLYFVNKVIDKSVDGIIIHDSLVNLAEVKKLVDMGTPIVSLENKLPIKHVRSVLYDYKPGFNSVIDEILTKRYSGTVNFGLFNRPSEFEHANRVLNAFQTALSDHGLKLNRKLLKSSTLLTDPYGEGIEYAKYILDNFKPFPACFIFHHIKALLGAMRVFTKAGLRVPEDVSLICMEDLILNECMMPAVSSFKIPQEECGMAASQILVDMILGKFPPTEDTVFKMGFNLRET